MRFAVENLCFFASIVIQALREAGQHEEAERLRDDFVRWLKGDFLEVLPQFFTPEMEELCGKLNALFSQEPMELLGAHWSFVDETFGKLRAKGFVPGTVSAADSVSAFLLQPSLEPLPPGHPLLQLLGVANEGDWKRLTPSQKWVMLFRVLLDEERKRFFAKKGMALLVKRAEDETAQSVSRERGMALSQLPPLEIEDPAATRFVAEIEDQDEAERAFDHLASQTHLSRAEHVIFAGLRQGLDRERLEDYAVQHGIARASVPVLASRLLAKLKAAAKS